MNILLNPHDARNISVIKQLVPCKAARQPFSFSLDFMFEAFLALQTCFNRRPLCGLL